MRVLVIGANGQTGTRVVRRLADGPHDPLAMIRDGAQASTFESMDVETVVADLEEPIDDAVEGCEAVVFAAGSGADTGLDKTVAVDRDGAVRSMVAAELAGVERYVMLSSMGADADAEGSRMAPYYRAKGVADVWLRRSGMVHSIVRPGRLTDEEGDGRIEAAGSLGRSGSIPRDDVAAVLVACLDDDRTADATFEILDGDTPVTDALAAVGGEGAAPAKGRTP